MGNATGTSFGGRAPGAAAGAPGRILVWDAPVRVAHWLMVISFAGAYLTGEAERWQLLHVTLGYTLAGLVVFRLLWGLFGSRHARFANFVRGPAAALRYLLSLWHAEPEHHAGHNPAGALAIVALLALAMLVTGSGWLSDQGLAGGWVEELHESAGSLMLAVVGLHIAGVLLGSWRHHENLVRAMCTGHKAGRPDEAIPRARQGVAVLLLVAVLGFWWWQWQTAPAVQDQRPGASAPHGEDRDDD